MEKKRIFWLDNLKGFLIILVVLGHCIQNTTESYQFDILFRYIYSFHMPLFMFVSGFVCYKHIVEWSSISKRFVQLIIPFFVWTVISAVLQYDYSLLYNNVLHPERSLWFLWALFFISAIHTISCRIAYIVKCREEVICFLVALMFFTTMRKFDLFCYPTIAKFYVYYIIGFYSKKHIKIISLKKRTCKYLAFVTLVLFLVFGYYSSQTGAPTFLPSNSSIIYGQVYNLGISFLAIISFMLLFEMYFYKELILTKMGGGNFRNLCHSSSYNVIISLAIYFIRV